MSITRASIVEPADGGGWLVDLSLVNGPVIGPFRYRSQGLDAEQQWLLAHHLPELQLTGQGALTAGALSRSCGSRDHQIVIRRDCEP